MQAAGSNNVKKWYRKLVKTMERDGGRNPVEEPGVYVSVNTVKNLRFVHDISWNVFS